MMYWFLLAAVILLFGLVAFRGAPYVPTHRRKIMAALDLMNLKSNDMVVDLGSGDGNFLIAAARRGWRAVGYEINPVLCLISWLRCLPWLVRFFYVRHSPLLLERVGVALQLKIFLFLNNFLIFIILPSKRELRVMCHLFAGDVIRSSVVMHR